MNRIKLLICCFFFSGSLLLAQADSVRLSVGNVVSSGGTELICVPIIANEFEAIAATQFSVQWDTTKLEFTVAQFGENPLGLNGQTTSMPSEDNFYVTTTTADLSGITLEAGTVLLSLCFVAVEESAATEVTFGGGLAPEFVKEGTTMGFPFVVTNGLVTYGSDVAVGVLPGDTNDDKVVNHVDLLNIGLAFGTDGPGRPSGATDFAVQVAPRWDENFTDGLNYAYADANGSGLIDAADLNVVLTNYGSSDNLWEPADGGTGRSAAAQLTLEGGPFIAEETSELRVVMGDDGTGGAASGYGLAFALDFNEDQIAANSIEVDFSNSFFGEDLLTLARVSADDAGRLEISLSRKDQQNTTAAPGEVCTLRFRVRNNDAGTNFDTEFTTNPSSYLLADESAAPISGSSASVMVMGTVGVREPEWGSALTVYPNPYTTGAVNLGGDLPILDRVKVLTPNGRLVQLSEGNVRNLSLEQLPAGNYLLRLERAGEAVTRPILKQ